METLCTFPLSLTSGSGFATDVIECSKLKRLTLLALPAVYHLKKKESNLEYFPYFIINQSFQPFVVNYCRYKSSFWTRY